MKTLFKITVVLLAMSPILGLRSYAQGVRYSNTVFTTGGFPFATIRICTEPAIGTPCSPLATVYSDPGLTQPIIQPFNADANGNFYFFGSPSVTYHVQVSGTGLQTFDIPYITLPGGGGGSGTVSSVGIAPPTGFIVTGGPVTSIGNVGFSMPTSWNTGSILYGNGLNSVASLAVGSAGQCLTITGGIPAWGSCGVTGATPNGGLVPTGPNLGLRLDCFSGQGLTWNGVAWVCQSSGTVTNVTGTTNQITVTTGNTTPALALANNTILPGNASAAGSFSAPTLTATGLTPGDCVQAGTGGLLTVAAAPCGSGTGGGGSATLFDSCTSDQSGNSVPYVIGPNSSPALTNYYEYGFEFLFNTTTAYYCQKFVQTSAAGATVIVDVMSGDSTAGHTANITYCDQVATSGGFNVGTFNCAASQTFTTNAGTYNAAQRLTFNVQTSLASNSYLLVKIGTSPSGTAPTSNILVAGLNFVCAGCGGGGGGGGGGSVTSVTGTANQITVVNPTTTPAISIPTNPILPGNVTATGSLASTSDGVHPTEITGVGQTTEPLLPANTAGFLWPLSAIFASYGFEFSTTSPAANQVIGVSAPDANGWSLWNYIPNSTTVNGQSCPLGGSCSISAGSSAWSALTPPSSNLAINLYNPTPSTPFTSTFTSGDFGVSPVAGVTTYTTASTSPTDTSPELNINIPPGSYHQGLNISIDSFNMLQVCNTAGTSHIGTVVIGSALPCPSLSTSPSSKFWSLVETVTSRSAAVLYELPTGYVGTLLKMNTVTPAGTGFNYWTACASALTSDGSCPGTNVVSSLRGDGLLTVSSCVGCGLTTLTAGAGLTGGGGPGAVTISEKLATATGQGGVTGALLNKNLPQQPISITAFLSPSPTFQNNSGPSFGLATARQWVTATPYFGALGPTTHGDWVTNGGRTYWNAGGSGVSGATAPTCATGTCSDGSITWTEQSGCNANCANDDWWNYVVANHATNGSILGYNVKVLYGESDWNSLDSGVTGPVFSFTTPDTGFNQYLADVNFPTNGRLEYGVKPVDGSPTSSFTGGNIATPTYVFTPAWATAQKTLNAPLVTWSSTGLLGTGSYGFGWWLYDGTTNCAGAGCYEKMTATGTNAICTPNGTVPTWPSSLNGTVTDGTCTWTNVGANAPPQDAGFNADWTAATANPAGGSGAGFINTQCVQLSITAFSGSSGTLTFTAANFLSAGNTVTLSAFTGGNTGLNGQSVTVLSAGLSSTQFEATVTGSGYASGTGSGAAYGYFNVNNSCLSTDTNAAVDLSVGFPAPWEPPYFAALAGTGGLYSSVVSHYKGSSWAGLMSTIVMGQTKGVQNNYFTQGLMQALCCSNGTQFATWYGTVMQYYFAALGNLQTSTNFPLSVSITAPSSAFSNSVAALETQGAINNKIGIGDFGETATDATSYAAGTKCDGNWCILLPQASAAGVPLTTMEMLNTSTCAGGASGSFATNIQLAGSLGVQNFKALPRDFMSLSPNSSNNAACGAAIQAAMLQFQTGVSQSAGSKPLVDPVKGGAVLIPLGVANAVNQVCAKNAATGSNASIFACGPNSDATPTLSVGGVLFGGSGITASSNPAGTTVATTSGSLTTPDSAGFDAGGDVVDTLQHFVQTSFLTSNYTNATNGFTSTAITFPSLAANTKYFYTCHLTFQMATSTNAVPVLQWSGPASPTLVSANGMETLTDGTSPVLYSHATSGATFAIAMGATSPNGSTATSTAYSFELTGVISNGANAGALTLQAKAASTSGSGVLAILAPSGCQLQ